jgi:EAL domain-containing protein (putative c-di-GMP-specific phosphodiesterase class I)
MHILQLAPDFIKLDRQLITGIDVDPARRSLVSSLLRFGEEVQATIVAEGIEHASELEAVRQLGIGHAQGLLLAHPGPVDELARNARRGALLARPKARGVPRARARRARVAPLGV